MVVIGTATDTLGSDSTVCCTSCFADICLSVTLPCIPCGKFIAVANLSMANLTSVHITFLRFVEGSTNHTQSSYENITGAPHGASMTLTGCADGDTLKIQARPASNTSTIYGTHPSNSFLHVLATDGASPVCTSVQNLTQSSSHSNATGTFTNVPGTALTLACRSGGKAIWGITPNNLRSGSVGQGTAIRICGNCCAIRETSTSANYASNPGLVEIDCLDGSTRNLQLRRVSSGTANLNWSCACPRDFSTIMEVFEIS